MLVSVETPQEFCARHGEHVDFDAGWLFEDGAYLTTSMRSEPPTDPAALLKAKRQFLRTKLNQKTDEFLRAKSGWTQQGTLAAKNWNLPAPPPNAVELLREMKDQVAALEKQIAEIDAQLGATPERQVEAERLRNDAERRRRISTQLSEINGINLGD